MSQAINLQAAIRQLEKGDIKETIPAVMYGSGVKNTSLSLKRSEFEKVFSQSGESGLISLKLDDGQELPVIVKDYQVDAIRNYIIHVDFFKVNMDEKVTAEVSLEYVGESPAVKAFGAIIVHSFDTLEIECLPKDLIQHIDVDLSVLAEIGDTITVADIKLPTGIIFTQDPNELVVHAIEPKKTVEDTAADAAIEAGANAEGEADAAAPDAKVTESKPVEKK
jgi:large subunit ribosomal protein L25